MACYTSKLALWWWLLFRETLQGNDYTSYRSWIPQWWAPSSPLHWLGTAALWQVLEIKESVAVNFIHNQSAWSSVKLKSIKSAHLVTQCSSSVCAYSFVPYPGKKIQRGRQEGRGWAYCLTISYFYGAWKIWIYSYFYGAWKICILTLLFIQ